MFALHGIDDPAPGSRDQWFVEVKQDIQVNLDNTKQLVAAMRNLVLYVGFFVTAKYPRKLLQRLKESCSFTWLTGRASVWLFFRFLIGLMGCPIVYAAKRLLSIPEAHGLVYRMLCLKAWANRTMYLFFLPENEEVIRDEKIVDPNDKKYAMAIIKKCDGCGDHYRRQHLIFMEDRKFCHVCAKALAGRRRAQIALSMQEDSAKMDETNS